MADSISGKFDYNSLVRTLRQKGVEGKDMQAALRQVAQDNHIDNIRDLDKSEKITINGSIFQPAATDPFAVDPTNPVGNFFAADNQTLQPFFMPPVIMTDGEEEKLPEIYNDEDYEVVDYDDYYNFGDEGYHTMEWRFDQPHPEGHAHTMEWRFDMEKPRTEAHTMEWRFDRDGQGAYELKTLPYVVNMTDPFAAEPDATVPYMAQAAYSANVPLGFVPANENDNTDVDTDREDLLEGAMEMQMDMQNDSFNA